MDPKGVLVRDAVEFARNLNFSDLPREVVEAAKTVILDALGAMLAASLPKYPAGKILTQIVRKRRLSGRIFAPLA